MTDASGSKNTRAHAAKIRPSPDRSDHRLDEALCVVAEDLDVLSARLSALESPAPAGDEEIVEVMVTAFRRSPGSDARTAQRAVLAALRARGSVIR